MTGLGAILILVMVVVVVLSIAAAVKDKRPRTRPIPRPTVRDRSALSERDLAILNAEGVDPADLPRVDSFHYQRISQNGVFHDGPRDGDGTQDWKYTWDEIRARGREAVGRNTWE